MSEYSVGSLFAGIGGIDLAFEAAGFHIEWQVVYPIAVMMYELLETEVG